MYRSACVCVYAYTTVWHSSSGCREPENINPRDRILQGKGCIVYSLNQKNFEAYRWTFPSGLDATIGCLLPRLNSAWKLPVVNSWLNPRFPLPPLSIAAIARPVTVIWSSLPTIDHWQFPLDRGQGDSFKIEVLGAGTRGTPGNPVCWRAPLLGRWVPLDPCWLSQRQLVIFLKNGWFSIDLS